MKQHLITYIATWFGAGYLKPMPGTWGSAAALPFGLLFLALHPHLLWIMTIIMMGLGYWAAREYMKETGIIDDKRIVVDEVVGMWIVLMVAGLNPAHIALGFVLFRVFDILKPWPIHLLESKFPNAFGVMADDIAAGALAAFWVYGIVTFGFGL